MVCPKCGRKITVGKKFCAGCGNPFDEQILEQVKKEKAKKTRIGLLIGAVVIAVGVVIAAVVTTNAKKEEMYMQAEMAWVLYGDYDTAFELFHDLGGYKDSAERAEQILEMRYTEAQEDLASGYYESAWSTFSWIAEFNYKDSRELADQIGDNLELLDRIQTTKEITDEVIAETKELLEEAQFLKNTDLQTRIRYFSIVCDQKWKFVSGDASALSLFDDQPSQCTEISTKISRNYGWYSESMTLEYGSGRKISVGISSGASFSIKEEEVTLIEKAYTKADITVTFTSEDQLEIELKTKDGQIYKAVYAPAA